MGPASLLKAGAWPRTLCRPFVTAPQQPGPPTGACARRRGYRPLTLRRADPHCATDLLGTTTGHGCKPARRRGGRIPAGIRLHTRQEPGRTTTAPRLSKEQCHAVYDEHPCQYSELRWRQRSFRGRNHLIEIPGDRIGLHAPILTHLTRIEHWLKRLIAPTPGNRILQRLIHDPREVPPQGKRLMHKRTGATREPAKDSSHGGLPAASLRARPPPKEIRRRRAAHFELFRSGAGQWRELEQYLG